MWECKQPQFVERQHFNLMGVVYCNLKSKVLKYRAKTMTNVPFQILSDRAVRHDDKKENTMTLAAKQQSQAMYTNAISYTGAPSISFLWEICI